MTPGRLQSWTPQEPSPHFADRTVAALLRDRARPRPRASKWWIAGGLIAAVLVTGAAFGLTGLARRDVAGPAAPPAPTPVEMSHDDCASCRAAPLVDRVEAPPAPSQDSPRRTPRREATLPPSADAGAHVPGGVKLPRCDCSFDQVICTCY